MAVSNKISMFKIISVFCAILILTQCFVLSISADTENNTTLMVTSATVEKGDRVSVSVNLKDNIGLWGLKFKVGYDHSILNLESVENGNVFKKEDVLLPDSLDKEEFVYLAYLNSLQNNKTDGTIVTLNFTVSDNAEFKPYVITLSVEQAINVDGKDVDMKLQEGAVSVVKCIHILNSIWNSDAKFHWHTCARNECGDKIENTVSPHQAVEIPAVKATCVKQGLTKGKKCSVCGFIMEQQKVIPAIGHSPVVIPAIKATTERVGFTKGKKCKICEEILVGQKKIPKIPYKMNKSARTSGKVKMYKKKNTSSKVIKTIKKGVKVKIVDIKGRWYQIKYKGKLGFVKSEALTWKGRVRTKEGKLRLRSGAGTKYQIINSFPSGTEVTIVSLTAKGWYKVQVRKSKKTFSGYMSNKYIIK